MSSHTRVSVRGRGRGRGRGGRGQGANSSDIPHGMSTRTTVRDTPSVSRVSTVFQTPDTTRSLRRDAEEAGLSNGEQGISAPSSATQQSAAQTSGQATLHEEDSKEESPGSLAQAMGTPLPDSRSATSKGSSSTSTASSRLRVVPKHHLEIDEFHEHLDTLLQEMQAAIVAADAENNLASAGSMVIKLFVSSPFYNDHAIESIGYIHAMYLMKAFELTGCTHRRDELIPAQEALRTFYQSTKERAAFNRAQRAAPFSTTGTPVTPRIPGIAPITSQFVDVQTGRTDSRRFPVIERKRVGETELTPQAKDESSQRGTLAHAIKKNVSTSPIVEQKPPQETIEVKEAQPALKDGPPSSSSSESASCPSIPTGCGRKHSNGSDDSSSSSTSTSSTTSQERKIKGRKNLRAPRGSVYHKEEDDLAAKIKDIINYFSKSENRWSGLRDTRYTTQEFIDHYNDLMDAHRVSKPARLKCLSFVFRGDAADEYRSGFRTRVKQGEFRNASRVIKALAKNLETSEYLTYIRDQWNTLTLADVREEGETLQTSFSRLVRKARRLQQRLGQEYSSDFLLCDFYRRAVQNEPFWAHVDDSSPKLTSRKLQGKIENAIEKEVRLRRRRRVRTVPESFAVDTRRFAQPNVRTNPKVRVGARKNPLMRDGTVMTCTGCGSDSHFYKDCTNPDKVAYRTKRLTDIAQLNSRKQRENLASYFLQMDDGGITSPSNNEDTDKDEGVASDESRNGNHDNREVRFDLDDARNIADELDTKLEESMFADAVQDYSEEEESYYTMCINKQTMHSFFGYISSSESTNECHSTTCSRTLELRPRTGKSGWGKLRYPCSLFPGIMVDNGSTGSLCSVSQLEAYRNFTGHPTPVRKLKGHYVISGHGGSECLGIATFRFPYGDTVITFDAPIVKDADTPLILGLRDQDRLLSKGVNQQTNCISFNDGPEMPVERDMGHLWIRWNYEEECLFTETELAKLHYRFGHPGIRRMHDFLKRIKLEDLDKNTRAMLADIQARCKECQFLAPKPYVVQVAVPREDLLFNSEVFIDIMYIQGKAVLHLVDRATHFQAARFLESDSTECVWRTFMEMWVLSYLGPPDNLRHDQGVQFVTPRLQAMCAEGGITCRPVGIESPHAMSIVERYHAPLRQTFLKLQETYGIKPLDTPVDAEKEDELPQDARGKQRKKGRKATRPVGVKDTYLLAVTVMCVNSTVGPEGICPTLLVFGAMPKLPLPGSLPAAVPQSERMKILETAREKYISLVAKMRLRQAEKAFVPRTPPTTLKFGDRILVYRETTGRWEPRKFVSRNDQEILVEEPNGEVQPYAFSKVSELREGIYLPRPDLYGIDDEDLSGKEPHVPPNERAEEPAPTLIAPEPLFDRNPFLEEPVVQVDVESGEPVDIPDTSPEAEAPRKTAEDLQLPELGDIDEILENLLLDLYKEEECHHVLVLSKDDPRRSLFDKSIQAEVKGLMDKGTFTEVRKSQFSEEERQKLNILKAKLILTIKDPGTNEEAFKARLVVQAIGSKDKDKKMLFTYSPTVNRSSVRIMLAVAAAMRLDIYLRDISQAYVSSDAHLLREVYVIPPPELGLDEDILWHVRRPLYGLPESGLLWFETYVSHHQDVLGMRSMEIDPCFLYRMDRQGKIEEMVCLQVDDSVGTGNAEFMMEENRAAQRFPTKPRRVLNDGEEIKFNGQYLRRKGNMIILHQRQYIDRMPSHIIERRPESFASYRGEAAYVSTCSRPDVTCAVNQLSQVKATEATESHFKRLDNVFRRLKSDTYELQFGNVDLETAELHVFADASFACNKDFSSQLGYVVVIVDRDKNCSLIAWSSVKSKRVTRSVLAAELYSIAQAYDAGFAIRHCVSKLLQREVSLRVFTDSKTLFDSIVTLCSMTEKRLLIDIAGLREAYRNRELSNLGWVRSGNNVADALTKDKKDSALHRILTSKTLDIPVAQWIVDGPIHEDSAENTSRNN